jgi:phosphoglycerate dehydrogenase-like enzyme
MNILIISSISPDAIEQLSKQHNVTCSFNPSLESLNSLIPDQEVLILRSGVRIPAESMDCAPNLKLVIRAGSGTDNLDLDYINKRGLKLKRIPEPGAYAVAELSFAFMVSLARNVLHADRLLREGRWTKYEFTGYLLRDKILGIIGAGNIGSRVGQLGAAWGMKVIGCVKNPSPKKEERLAGKGIQLKDFFEVISEADFLSIHVPLDESTRYMINAEALSSMKSGSFLINLSRGGVVNEQDLYKTLTKGDRLLGAALDVHEVEGEGCVSPLASLPNVVLTPHIGAQTHDTQYQIGVRILEIIDSFESDPQQSEIRTSETKLDEHGSTL